MPNSMHNVYEIWKPPFQGVCGRTPTKALSRYGCPLKDLVSHRQLEMCITILARTSRELDSKYGVLLVAEVIPALVFAFGDTFPDTKRLATSALIWACKLAPDRVCERALDFFQCLTANLNHHHAKIRISMTETLVYLVGVASSSSLFSRAIVEVILPSLNKITQDHSASVFSGALGGHEVNSLRRFEPSSHVHWECY
mmetsp:Transcript_5584/g.17190  ORF Transcript_5584/g.17190 Transcript_5584/m.17190 type:complete len:198 (+) Transcript_5584:357-950(+)